MKFFKKTKNKTKIKKTTMEKKFNINDFVWHTNNNALEDNNHTRKNKKLNSPAYCSRKRPNPINIDNYSNNIDKTDIKEKKFNSSVFENNLNNKKQGVKLNSFGQVITPTFSLSENVQEQNIKTENIYTDDDDHEEEIESPFFKDIFNQQKNRSFSFDKNLKILLDGCKEENKEKQIKIILNNVKNHVENK
jgi:hypothetical protein